MSYNSLFGLGSHSPDADLQAWWKLDTSLDDSSGKNKVLSVAGGSPAPSVDSPTTWLAGSYEFDGATDSLLHNAALASGQARGIVCWVKKRSEGGGGFGRVWSNNSANNVLRAGGTDWVATTPSSVSASGAANGQWDFIYVARNGSNTGFIARNAETPSSVVNSSGTIDNDVFYIGNGNAGNRGFDGFIASVAFFNRYLLQAERDELYAGPEPLNTELPTLDMGSTSWSGTVGAWDSQNNGTVSYAWELRLVEDDSVVESGGGEFPSGTGTYNNANGYYLAVDATNDGGTDLEARSRNLPEGLGDEVAWYCPSIDDSPDDLSGNSNDGTYNGGMGTVADTNAGGQRAYELDGVDDSINLTGSNFLSGLGSASLSTWAYIDNFSDTNIIYHESTDSAASLSRLAFFVRADGQLRVGGRIDDGNSFTVFANSANSAVSLGSWHHLAAVCDFVSGTHRVYLDGIDITDSSSSTTGAFDANLPDAIKVGTNNANYFAGRIDDFRIYGRAISEIEITHLATQRGVLGPPGGIDLDYLWSPTQGDETSLGPIANIGTAGTQDLVTSNVTGNMAWVSDTDKDGLYAIDMEDRDSYRWDPFSTAYSAVTLGCWVKCLDADESGYILSLGSNTSSLWLAAEFRTGGNIRIWSNGVPTQVSDGGITKTDWNHIAVQYDGTNAKLFVNGTEVASATSAAPSTYNEAVFGTGGTSVFGVEGRIDGMFLEYSELTDPEIAELAVDRTYPTNIDPTEGWHNPFRNSFFYNPFFDNEAL